MTDMRTPTLKLENLGVQYRVKGEKRQILHGINIEIAPGEAYGIVGESGCGKSTAAYAVLRYLPRNGSVNQGRILIKDQDVFGLGNAQLRELRRTSVAMVYQDPGRALNPTIRVGRQIEEVFELAKTPKSELAPRTKEVLKHVRISDPQQVMERYPHQLSGGMQQRVAIAMALASRPTLLVLDEPTTGLDATVEADILDLILQLRRDSSTSILFISHNLAVVAKMCDRVGVLYAGRLVEEGSTRDVFGSPRHPYTVGLLRCLPQRGRSKNVALLTTIPGVLPPAGAVIPGCVFSPRCTVADDICRTVEPHVSDLGNRLCKCHYPERASIMAADKAPSAVQNRPQNEVVSALEVQHLNMTYGAGPLKFKALNDVSLTLGRGETLGLVGESGSGKTTLARNILGIIKADAGSVVRLEGKEAAAELAGRTLEQVKALQIVFQNPDSALNRSHTVRHMISRTIAKLSNIGKRDRAQRVQELTRAVRLSDRHLNARPNQLSGGLKQRVAIARAFAGDPRIVVCDEPTSALDVSVQAAILNLLVELQTSKQVSFIFISHDLGVVRYLSDRIAVLYLGRVMEVGPAEDVFSGPHHPYTEALLSSVPSIDGKHPERVKLDGELPSALKPPSGCVFHTRCSRKLGSICENTAPELVALNSLHAIRCHIPADRLPRYHSTY